MSVILDIRHVPKNCLYTAKCMLSDHRSTCYTFTLLDKNKYQIKYETIRANGEELFNLTEDACYILIFTVNSHLPFPFSLIKATDSRTIYRLTRQLYGKIFIKHIPLKMTEKEEDNLFLFFSV